MPLQELKFPKEFIDRKAEQDLFKGLMEFNEHARLFAVQDKRGTGKSTLLELLQHQCKFKFYSPVGFVQLDVPSINSAFVFIETLRNSIGLNEPFSRFDGKIAALAGKIMVAFAPVDIPINVSGNISAQSNISGGTQIGAQVNIASGEWNEAIHEQARNQCIKAFFEDLKSLYDENPLVVMLDSYDRCSEELKTWIIEEFVLPLSFNINKRPQRLLIVLSGRELPDFTLMLEEKYSDLVRASSPLSGWEKEHVNEFLKVHQYTKLSDKDMDFVWEKIEKGFSIQQALMLADVLTGE
ncbi:MAG: hypothetical protein AABM67_17470 [Acidobacteriota bacterium]